MRLLLIAVPDADQFQVLGYRNPMGIEIPQNAHGNCVRCAEQAIRARHKGAEFLRCPVSPRHRTLCFNHMCLQAVHQIGDHLWEGRYSPRGPDGKQRSRNVYGHTQEECEEKLKVLIETTKAEIQAERRQLREAGNQP